MTDSISPKFLVALALSLLVAAFGGWRLLTAESGSLDTGFEGVDQLPAVVTTAPATSVPTESFVSTSGRNPFTRTDGATSVATDSTETAPLDETAPADDTAPLDAAGTEFPDPALAAQGPSAASDAAAEDS